MRLLHVLRGALRELGRTVALILLVAPVALAFILGGEHERGRCRRAGEGDGRDAENPKDLTALGHGTDPACVMGVGTAGDGDGTDPRVVQGSCVRSGGMSREGVAWLAFRCGVAGQAG